MNRQSKNDLAPSSSLKKPSDSSSKPKNPQFNRSEQGMSPGFLSHTSEPATACTAATSLNQTRKSGGIQGNNHSIKNKQGKVANSQRITGQQSVYSNGQPPLSKASFKSQNSLKNQPQTLTKYLKSDDQDAHRNYVNRSLKPKDLTFNTSSNENKEAEQFYEINERDFQTFQNVPSQQNIDTLQQQNIQGQIPDDQGSTGHQILKHAKSLYQFIVPVAQLNLGVPGDPKNESQLPTRDQLAGGSPFNRHLAAQGLRQNRSQAQGAGPGRFALIRDPFLNHKRDLSNTNNRGDAQVHHQFSQMDQLTNFDGPSSVSSRQLTYSQYQQARGGLNFMSYEHKTLSSRQQFQEGGPNTRFGPEDTKTDRVRMISQNKIAAQHAVQNFHKVNQKISSQFVSTPKSLVTNNKNLLEKLHDRYRLKITVHSVQIDIPSSIKMIAQGLYNPSSYIQPSAVTSEEKYKAQAVSTDKKCQIQTLNATKQSENGEEDSVVSQKIKIADFKDQEIYLDIYADSNIKYNEEHQKIFEKIKQKKRDTSGQQKCSIKLLAISDDKTKLIGIINYQFIPRLDVSAPASADQFIPEVRATMKFQKSIDPTASMCFSSQLVTVKQFCQDDYEKLLVKKSHKKIKGDFTKADDMGDETIVSQTSMSNTEDKQTEPEKITDDCIPPEAEDSQQLQEVRMSNSPSKPLTIKKGINAINCSQTKMRGTISKSRTPPFEDNSRTPEASVTVETLMQENEGKFIEESELDQDVDPKPSLSQVVPGEFQNNNLTAFKPQMQSEIHLIQQARQETDDKLSESHNIELDNEPKTQMVVDKNKKIFLGGQGQNEQQMQMIEGPDGELQEQLTVRKTWDFLYQKIQIGVNTVQKAYVENQQLQYQQQQQTQNGMGRRCLSSNQPLNRYGVIHNPPTFNYPEHDDNEYQLRQQRPPLGSSSRASGGNRNVKNPSVQIHQNELETLQKEKSFLQKKLDSQQEKFDDQIQLLQDKLKSQEKKYKKQKDSLVTMKTQLEGQMNTYIEIQQQNESEFMDEYEYMMHLYTRQQDVKDLFESKFTEAVKEREAAQITYQNEIEKLNQSNKEEIEKINEGFEEEREAFQQRIGIQQEEIEAHINEKLQKNEHIEGQDTQVKNEQCKVQDLQKQIEELQKKVQMGQIREEGMRQTQVKEVDQRNQEVLRLKQMEEKLIDDKNEQQAQIQQVQADQEDLKQQLLHKQEIINQKEDYVEKIKSEQYGLRQDIDELRTQSTNQAELKDQNLELMQRLRLTEEQLIQVKSSWAESEHEREQYFNQIQDQEERIEALNQQAISQKQTIHSLIKQTQKTCTDESQNIITFEDYGPADELIQPNH